MKKITSTLLSAALLLFAGHVSAQSKNTKPMKQKILFVVTSHDKKGSTGEATGYYLAEVSHPWKVLTEAGYEIDFVSPKGGNPPVDGFDLSDPDNKAFWEDSLYHNKISHSLKPSEVTPGDYAAIYYAGGHGAMWDLPDNTAIAGIASAIYEKKGIVAAVCHGPAGLLAIKLANGKYLLDGKKVNGFSNEEEALVKLSGVVPFLLEDQLKKRGGIYEKSGPWQEHVVVDQRVITGQNPQSAKAVGEALRKELAK